MCLMVSNIHLTDTLSHVSEVRALTDTKLPEKQRPHVMENELPLGGWGGVKPTQSLVVLLCMDTRTGADSIIPRVTCVTITGRLTAPTAWVFVGRFLYTLWRLALGRIYVFTYIRYMPSEAGRAGAFLTAHSRPLRPGAFGTKTTSVAKRNNSCRTRHAHQFSASRSRTRLPISGQLSR
jgi:hypothetical protein